MNKQIIIFGSITLILLTVWWWFFVGRDTYSKQNDANSPKVLSEETHTIIAFGDSLTAGYGVSQAEAYPAQLEVALRQAGYKVSVINSGVSGETTRGNLERANFISSQNPDIIILGIGGNDALRSLPIEEIKKNIVDTIGILRNSEAKPELLLLEMQAPLNSGFAYKKQFDALYEDIAKDQKLILVPFLTKDIFFDTASKLPDGIHYNKLGYEKAVKQYIFPSITKLLDKMNNADE